MKDKRKVPQTARRLVPICAIGASAGGVTALQNLFRHVPDNLGLAYVVILHLSPEHPSALQEILSACTRMSVLQVKDSSALKPNCVYVIPPDRELVIEGDNVSARPFSEPRGRRAQIDMFFRSVAAARGDGVAIVLSGAGADGALGVRSVKEAGGVVMVQEPAEADYAPMPQNAIATGVADFVGPVARLAERLKEVAESKEAVRSLDADGAANDLRRIVAFLRSRTGHDFSSYKRATVLRRVTRRMQVCRTNTLAAYADYLQTTPEEAKELFADLLISVTMFFRDPRAFEALERRVLGPIFDSIDEAGEEGIRAWVVGCATGEEAYSLAILMMEEAARRKVHVPIQIFATDLDEGALATAREGRYPKSIHADVSEERLSRFFVDEGAHYRVRKELRDAVLFATHSVLKEPPFLRLDLISCRNLLIYLERVLQQQLCSVFHYALKPSRFLFLGSAEAADASGDLFATLDRDARIYVANPRAHNVLPVLPQFPSPERLTVSRFEAAGHAAPALTPGAAHLAALEELGPPSILVDGSYNIIHLSPTAGRFILHSGGPLSRLLPAIARPELRLDLKLALSRAIDQAVPTVTHPIAIDFEGDRRRVAMHVTPVASQDRGGAQALVRFLDGGPALAAEAADGEGPSAEEARRLHEELKAAQEVLVASRSGHDVTVQELRAANEELQSTNEEYRSTAEELETSREELRSISEELQTVNAELKSKLETISVAHSGLQNLTAATEIGTLFLDGDLRIKMFTPPVALLFNITQNDIGRVITDFTHQLDYPGLTGDARDVLKDLAPVEREVSSSDGRWYVARLRPYRTIEDRIDGVVLTFVDITKRLETEAALRRSERELRALVRASSQVLYRMSPKWDQMRELFGGSFLSSTEGPTESWLDHYIPKADHGDVRDAIDIAIRNKSVFELEHRVRRADGTIGWLHSRAIPLLNPDGEIAEWFGSASDVTTRRKAEDALRESEERLRVLIENVPQHIWRAFDGGQWSWSSPQWRRFTGLSEDESAKLGWLAAVHSEDREHVMAAWHRAIQERLFEVECRIRHAETDDHRWFRGRALPLLDDRGRVLEWFGTFTDVDDLRALQEHQKVLLAELQHRVRNTLAMIRTLVSRTGEGSETVEAFAALLEGRLGALARTQLTLARAAGANVDLEGLVRDELLAQTATEEQAHVSGPPVELSPKTAEVLALAIHEMATNSVKYGALAVPRGRIEVAWRAIKKKAGGWIELTWSETGVTVVAPSPRREGFGTELIERRVPYELKGEGEVELRPGGVRYRIGFPRGVRSVSPADAE